MSYAHPSYERLLLIAQQPPFEITRPAELARYLTAHGCPIEANRIGNWKSRGVPSALLTKVAELFNVREAWIQTGVEPIRPIVQTATVQVQGVSATGDAGQVDPVIQYLAVLLPEDADVWIAQIKAAATKRMRELGKLEAPPDIKKDPLSA